MYPYHNRIKQRIRAGELQGHYFTDNYPRHWHGSGAGVQHRAGASANQTEPVGGV